MASDKETVKPRLVGLRVRNPTPSTIEYTVTTRPETWSQRFTTLFVLKTIFLSIIAFIILLKQEFFETGLDEWFQSFIIHYFNTRLENLALVYGKLHWVYLLFLGFCGIWVASLRGYTEERLLILRGLGVQTSTSSSSYLVKAETRFIPTSAIQDIFIHEGFVGFEVRFYLAVIVRDESDVVVVFPKLLPRREILENVWRGSRSLYEPETRAR